MQMSVVRYVYFAPHTLHAAADAAQLDELISSDAASITTSIESFVKAGLDMAGPHDIAVLPLLDDGVGTRDLVRRQYRLFEIIDDIDNAYACDFCPLVRPTERATLRISPILQGVVAGEWLGIAKTQLGFLANFTIGTHIAIDTPVEGRAELVLEEIDGSRVRVSGWADDVVPGDGADVLVVGVVVSDPTHVCSVQALNDWRGNAIGTGGGTEAVDANVDIPTSVPGEAIRDGSSAVSGLDSGGIAYAAVRTPGTQARGAAVVLVSFVSRYEAVPYMTLCPANANAAALVPPPYVDATKSGFAVRLASPEGALTSATVYAWTFSTESSLAPVYRRPVSLADFNEDLYRLLYSPTDLSMPGKTAEAVFEDYLAHPERIACERDMAKLTQRTFDITVARTAMSIAQGAILTFQAPHGGSVTGIAGVADVDAGTDADSPDADQIVPTLAAVLRLLKR